MAQGLKNHLSGFSLKLILLLYHVIEVKQGMVLVAQGLTPVLKSEALKRARQLLSI